MSKSIASLSLDLDNIWSYMKTHGDQGWETYPSYLDVVVPRILEFLDELNLSITFFIVGKDATLEKNWHALSLISKAGHEIGNHSLQHEPWLHLYGREQMERELQDAHEAIMRATGKSPIGFRGPGYSVSRYTIETLGRLGYLYDASTLPTYIGPLARAYYFMHSKLSKQQMSQRRRLFGSLKEGFLPNKPYIWDSSTDGIIEIPVTTMPIFRIPFHLSYILFISKYSYPLAISYFRTALSLCRITGTQPSILLHPLDFLGQDDLSDLSFFPGMDMHHEEKILAVKRALELLKASHEVVSLEQYARLLTQNTDLVVHKSDLIEAEI